MKHKYNILLVFIVFTFLALETIALANSNTTVPATFFGMHVHKYDKPWPSINFKAVRLWDTGVRWDMIESSDNSFNFTKLDKQVSTALSHNVDVLYTLGLTPTWASKRPSEVSAHKVFGITSEPKDLSYWKRFVTKVAERYKGKIKYYEIWNEPAAKGFYTGDVETMVQLTKVAFETIKTIDPDAKIICPPSTAQSNGAAWLDEFLSKGGGKYVDIIGYHFYVGGKPEQTIKVIRHVKKILDKHNIKKPIWNTETGWSKTSLPIEDNQKSAYVARSYILNWNEGVQRFYWYAWDNHDWVSIEMTNKDGSLTKAAIAYDEIQNWLIGNSINECTVNNENTWICSITSQNNNLSWIVWNTDKSLKFNVPSQWNVTKVKSLDKSSYSVSKTKIVDIGFSPILFE